MIEKYCDNSQIKSKAYNVFQTRRNFKQSKKEEKWRI